MSHPTSYFDLVQAIKENADRSASFGPRIPKRLFRVENLSNVEKAIRNVRSNHILFFNNLNHVKISIPMNQKIDKIIIHNCHHCVIQVLDSVVITSQTVEMVNCSHTELMFDCVDVRLMRCIELSNCNLQFGDFETLIDNTVITWYRCNANNNTVQRTEITKGTDPNKVLILPVTINQSFSVHLPSNDDDHHTVYCSRFMNGRELETIPLSSSSSSDADAAAVHYVGDILQEVEQAEAGNAVVSALSNEQLAALYEEEIKETEDSEEEVLQKVKAIAAAIRDARHVVVYTGAGISTSAKIPDYRGPQGVWTLKSKGRTPDKSIQFENVQPTFAHYAIAHMVKNGTVSYVTSTNLDGLHRRSGIPENKISELHGNCYREVCANCDAEYLRSFDTLASRTDRWTHLTGRTCRCGGPLKDTIVHFTENMPTREWNLAVEHARESDVAIVLGTSMNVQPAASLPDKALLHPNGKLFIVNLQKTPFDHIATQKVHTRTDNFMELLVNELGWNIDTHYDHLVELKKQYRVEAIQKFLPLATAIVGVGIAAVFLASRLKK